jgi:hypothetical protein
VIWSAIGNPISPGEALEKRWQARIKKKDEIFDSCMLGSLVSDAGY